MNSTQSGSLSNGEIWRLLILTGICIAILANAFQDDGAPLVASAACSGIAYVVTFSMIRWLGPVFMKAGLKGRDMAKPRRPEMYGQRSFLYSRVGAISHKNRRIDD